MTSRASRATEERVDALIEAMAAVLEKVGPTDLMCLHELRRSALRGSHVVMLAETRDRFDRGLWVFDQLLNAIGAKP